MIRIIKGESPVRHCLGNWLQTIRGKKKQNKKKKKKKNQATYRFDICCLLYHRQNDFLVGGRYLGNSVREVVEDNAAHHVFCRN